MNWEVLRDVGAVASPIVAVLALFIALRNRQKDDRQHREDRREAQAEKDAKRRENQIRRGEVLQWVNESITALQMLVLVADDELRSRALDSSLDAEIVRLGRELSILAERGRMFFKNADDPHGAKKLPAYRGIRPEILDQLVIAFAITRHWTTADAEQRRRMRFLAALSEKRFASLAQSEVGRSEVASLDAAKAGSGERLALRLNDVDEAEMRQWEHSFGTMM